MSGVTKKYKLENYDLVASERDRMMMAMHDIQNNRVTWGGWHWEENADGKYRVGLSRDGDLLIQIWRHPGQSDSITVHDAYRFEADVRRSRMNSESVEPVLQAILSAKRAMEESREVIVHA